MAITTLGANDSGSTSRTVINDNFTDLDTTKADLASPTFTGTPTLPTGTIAVTQSAGDNSTKVATTAYVNNLINVETTASATHSLTTVAGQRVVVWAKGTITANGATITLKYNGVTKDTLTHENQVYKNHFAMMYTETPGAATANITIETSVGSITDASIVVLKLG